MRHRPPNQGTPAPSKLGGQVRVDTRLATRNIVIVAEELRHTSLRRVKIVGRWPHHGLASALDPLQVVSPQWWFYR